MTDYMTPVKSSSLSQAASLRLTPTNSPSFKTPIRSPIRSSNAPSFLSLKRVIGTTTTAPTGFSIHEASRSLAYCAGSAVVVAELDEDYNVSQRFYKARPTTPAINPTVSYYDGSPTASTPERRRRSIAPLRPGYSGYSPSSSPSREWIDGGGSKTWTSRERIKSATAVSLSPDGRYLAVGETGYNPRVLIFSTARDAPVDIPVTILADHSFGIRAVAFSRNSQYLATLGDTNDGFLFIWSINSRNGSAQLMSTNKCTAFVHDMVWMGNNLVTVGTRHVKVWRASESQAEPSSPTKTSKSMREETSSGPNARTLSGRNCLLGNLVDAKFTCVTAISEYEAIACTSRGDICLIDDKDGQQKLTLSKTIELKIQCITVDFKTNAIWIGGKDGIVRKENLNKIRELARSNQTSSSGSQLQPTTSLSPAPTTPTRQSTSSRKRDLFALAAILDRLVILDGSRTLSVSLPPADESEDEEPSLEKSSAAHCQSVQGVEAVRGSDRKMDFVTWSSDGDVKCWTSEGILQSGFTVMLDQFDYDEELEIRNELKIVRPLDGGSRFITADKYGVMRAFNNCGQDMQFEVRAHGAEITDMAIFESSTQSLIASSGRDRMLQLFSSSSDTLDLIQTMDDHNGVVHSVLFTPDGQRLLSGSSDRTIIVRERIQRPGMADSLIAFAPLRVVTLKAAPVSMTLVPGEQDSLVVSTMNHQVLRLEPTTGVQLQAFKAAESDNSDLIVLSTVKLRQRTSPDQPRWLVGISSTDKSVRVYDLDRGQLLTREFGHSEGVTDVAIVERDEGDGGNTTNVITTGLDGTIMIWDLSTQNVQVLQDIGQGRTRASETDGTPIKENVAMRTPLRRVLSRSELSEHMLLEPSVGSPGRTRANSPPRLMRKSSRSSLISQGNKLPSTSPVPSLPTIPANSVPAPKQRSPVNARQRNRSPSPPPVQTTPRTPNRANNARLRRPPSIPVNLRSTGRTKSNDDVTPLINKTATTTQPTTPLSANALAGQLCKTLQEFRKKVDDLTLERPLQDQPFEELSLRELDAELANTKQLIQARLNAMLVETKTENDIVEDIRGEDLERVETEPQMDIPDITPVSSATTASPSPPNDINVITKGVDQVQLASQNIDDISPTILSNSEQEKPEDNTNLVNTKVNEEPITRENPDSL